MTIRVVLADDHPIFRDGLVRSLEESGRFTVVGTGADADEAVALVAEHRPDLVLLDISMPGSGIEAARRIAAGANPPRIAVVTVSEQDQDVIAALRAGAIGYVLKGVSAAELTEILVGVAAGEAHVCPIWRRASSPRSNGHRRAARRTARSTTSASARPTSCAASPAGSATAR